MRILWLSPSEVHQISVKAAADMTNLLISIYSAFALVALSELRQLNPDPQYQKTSLVPSSQELDNRYETQGITLYLTLNEIKSLQDANDSSNVQLQSPEIRETQEKDFQSYNKTQQQGLNQQQQQQQEQFDFYNQYEKMPLEIEEPKAELRGLVSHNSFYPIETPVFEKQQKNDFVNSYPEQKTKEGPKEISYSNFIKITPLDNLENKRESSSKTSQESTVPKETEWKPFNPESGNQEQALLHEQLQEHWNRILDHNRVQLKELSTKQTEKQNVQANQVKEENQVENANKQREATINNNEMEQKSEIEKQIEAILRDNQDFNEGRQEFVQSEGIYQTPPIIIQKEVSVTRHLPVHAIRHVRVPVPVLVPVPEPYEVKVPHPYPVPLKVVKHIPVPVLKYN